MTIVDEAMARLCRDRPEMSLQSVEYVRVLVEWVQAEERSRTLDAMLSRTATSVSAGSPVPSDS
jgi:hypothetical protein